MAIEGLTQQQSDFVKRFLAVPKVFGRKAAKKARREAAEQFRLFNAEHDLIREEIGGIADAGLRSTLLAQLRGAEAIIEKDPEALDFAGGHQHLEDVRNAVLVHIKKADAARAYAQLETAMARRDRDNPKLAKAGAADAQSGIALTWTFVQGKFEKGMGTNDLKELDAALKAMGRLEVMMRDAETAAQNPFEERASLGAEARAAALAGLDDKVLAARRQLSEIHVKLTALRDRLTAQFGEEGHPLTVVMGCQTTQRKLDEAVDADHADLPGLADEAQDAFTAVNRQATRLIEDARGWVRAEAAFKVRYAVMEAHKSGADKKHVKPRFDKIRAGFSAAREQANAHEYAPATAALELLRNTLKDDLDFADDHSRFWAVYNDRKALLKTLPSTRSLFLEQMKKDRKEIIGMMNRAGRSYDAGQLSAAVTLLNQIPKAVEALLDLNRFVNSFLDAEVEWEARQKQLENLPPKVKAFLAKDIAHCASAGKQAQKDSYDGNYRRASGLMWELVGVQEGVLKQTAFIADYLKEAEAFSARRKETRARKGDKGRIAIEPYHQALIGDGAKRRAAETSGDLRLAHAMCVRLKPDHAQMMKRADQAQAYLARKKAFDTELAKLEGAGSADAKAALATAQEMLGHAVAATARGNWLGAENLLQSAVLEIKRAVSDAETAALIDGMQGGADGITLTADTEFATVYAAFAKVLAHVRGMDTETLFDAALGAADTKAKSVEALIGSDLKKAQAALDEAIAACKAVALQITAAQSYAAQRDAAKALIKALADADKDKVAEDELTRAKEALAAAKTAAEGAARDFAGAITTLGNAQALARQGLDALDTYADPIKDARDKMAEAITAYRKDDVDPYLEDAAARLETLRDEMNAAFDARQFPGAIAKATEGVELAGHHAAQCEACRKAVQMYQWVLAENGIEQTHALVVEDMAAANALAAAALEALAAGRFRQAELVGDEAYWAIIAARAKAEAFDAYLPIKLACEGRLTALEDRSVAAAGPAHEAVQALRNTFDAAVAKDALHNYAGATKLLEGFEAASDAAAGQLDLYDRCMLHKDRAAKALAKVHQLPIRSIETLIARLEGKERNAERKAQAFDFVTATALFVELQEECANAEKTAEAVEDFAAMTVVLKSIPEGDLDELNLAIGKARSTLKELVDQPSALYVHEEILQCDAQLDRAEETAPDDFPEARRDLEEVLDTCVQMTLLMGQYDQLNDTAALARRLAGGQLSKGAEADFAREELGAKLASIDVAMNNARQSRSFRAQSQVDLEDTIAALRDLRAVIDDHAAYLKQRGKVEKTHARLEKHALRHLMRDDLTDVRKLLDRAATRAAERKHKDAAKVLEEARVLLDLTKLRAKLGSNQAPKPKEIKALFDAPGGLDHFDKMVAGLEGSVQRKVMAVAFEVRFGCKLELQRPGDNAGDAPVDEDKMRKPAVNIRRFYDEMARLPGSNTLDNDSMVTFYQLRGDQEGSAFSPSEKKVVMREGDAATSGTYALALEHEIGEIDDRAIPKPGEERTAFSWNTLHEVGHAVDDKLGYMNKHGERLAGWKVYGPNVAEPAAEIAGHFKFDADYVAEYMVSAPGTKLPMPKVKGCTPDVWQRRMEECRMFVDRARNGNSPWASASIADACVIGKYTYIESYKNSWCRYLTRERRLAITGYQFRAPGEWFSEIYAAVVTGRINDKHPHRAEIAKLCLKEDA